MVGSAGNAPVRRFRLCFATPDLQAGSRITSLKLVAGMVVAPTESRMRDYEARLNLILPAIEKWWRRRVTLPFGSACRAGASLFCHAPIYMFDLRFGRPPWCCPTPVKFWGLVCASWRAACLEIANGMVRLPGIAPGRPPWRGDILLLNHNREIKRAGAFSRRRPMPFQ